MVTEPSSSEPQLAQQSEGPGNCRSVSGPWFPPRRLTSFPAPSWPFWEDHLGPTMCYVYSPPSPHPRPWRPLNSAKNRLKATLYGAENRGVYLAWASSPWSLLRRACRRAEGGLQNPSVRWWDL